MLLNKTCGSNVESPSLLYSYLYAKCLILETCRHELPRPQMDMGEHDMRCYGKVASVEDSASNR